MRFLSGGVRRGLIESTSDGDIFGHIPSRSRTDICLGSPLLLATGLNISSSM